METVNDQINVFELGVNEEAKEHLGGISLWMQVNAITAFISMAVSLISAIMAFVQLSSYGSNSGAPALAGALIMAIISVAINILLIQAAGNIKKGLARSEQGYFNLGLSKMATYFKVMGILIIIALSFFILAMFFSAIMR
jgi:Family of unknown function (DUF5362)